MPRRGGSGKSSSPARGSSSPSRGVFGKPSSGVGAARPRAPAARPRKVEKKDGKAAPPAQRQGLGAMIAQGLALGAGFALGRELMRGLYGPDGLIPAWMVPLLIGGGFAAYYLFKRGGRVPSFSWGRNTTRGFQQQSTNFTRQSYTVCDDATKIQEVLEFWYDGPVTRWDRQTQNPVMRKWFDDDPRFDNELRERFQHDVEEIAEGNRESWKETNHGMLAYIILSDQVARNIYRNNALRYATDHLALDAAIEVFEKRDEMYNTLANMEKQMILMPLMHAENLEYGQYCLDEIIALIDQNKYNQEVHDHFQDMKRFAEDHFSVISAYGRYPHRNEILGRVSTAEELEYLRYAKKQGH